MPPDALQILLAQPVGLAPAHSVRRKLHDALQDHQVIRVRSQAELSRRLENELYDVVLIDLTGGQADGQGWVTQARLPGSRAVILVLLDADSEWSPSGAVQAGAAEAILVTPGWHEQLRDWLAQAGRTPVAGRQISLAEEYQRLQKRARLWAALSQVGHVLSSTLEPDRVLQLILEQAVHVLGAEGGSLVLVDHSTNELVFELALGPTAAELVGTRMPWGVGLVGEAAATGEPLVVNDTATDPRWFSGYDEATDFVTQRILCAPMITRQQVIGVLELVNKRDGSPFTEDETELLITFAAQAAAALTNARLYAATRRQAEEVSALLEVSQAVNSTLDLNQRLRIIGRQAKDLIAADGCIIFLLDDANQKLKPIMALDDYADEILGFALELGEGISGKVAQTGTGRIVNQVHMSPDAAWVPNTPQDEPEALLSVPLQVKGLTIGVMTLSRQGERDFTNHELELITSLGNHAAAAIENARLYSASRQRNRELTVLYNVALAVGQTLEMDQLLGRILLQVPEVLGSTGGAICLVSGESRALELVNHRELPDTVLQVISQQLDPRGLVGRAAATSQIVDEPAEPPENGPTFRLVCTPLLSRQGVLGVLVITGHPARPIDLEERRLLETIGRQAGVAIENALLYTQLQERAERLQRAYDELAEIDRLKDELVQNISHELRTPITFIKGYVSLLVDGELGELQPTQLNSLEIVANKTEQLIQLVGSILTLQTLTPDSLKKESISPVDLASGAIAGAALAAQKAGVRIVAHYPTEMPSVMVDPSRVTQVFDNLLQNAIKFSPGGGVITVRMHRLKEWVQVEVSDTGIGIPADKVGHIFERFYQVDGSMTRRFGGAGLGLAICKQIITAHGGDIQVSSQEGKGSTFAFSLPLVAADPRN